MVERIVWAYLKIQEDARRVPAEVRRGLRQTDRARLEGVGRSIKSRSRSAPSYRRTRSRHRPRHSPISASSRRSVRRNRELLGRLVRRQREQKMKLTGGLLLDHRASKRASGAGAAVAGGRPVAGRRPDGSLFGGVLPTPDRGWDAWKIWRRPGRNGTPTLQRHLARQRAAVLDRTRCQGIGAAILFGCPARHRDRLVAPCCRRFRSDDPGAAPIPITAWLPFPSRCSASATWARCS